MKTGIFIFLFLYSCSLYVDQRSNNASIKFSSEEYDFGVLKPDSEATCNFDFNNSGTTSLIIINVTTSCGCTVPNWPEKPVRPGENASITIHYDTSFPGVFHKTVSVFYNGEDSPKILTVKGVVESENDTV
jgi:hypothetical protein